MSCWNLFHEAGKSRCRKDGPQPGSIQMGHVLCNYGVKVIL
jgi:hypothetical protein